MPTKRDVILKIARAEVLILLVCLGLIPVWGQTKEQRTRRRGPAVIREVSKGTLETNSISPKTLSPPLPSLPAGVAELKFEDLFQTPVGPKGLEFTDRIKTLNGKRVRISGFMVREEVEKHDGSEQECVKGRFLLTPLPTTVSPSHYGLADDLPPQTVFVTAPELKDQTIQYSRGPMLLTGILSVGNRAEPDGRISAIRLTLDPAQESKSENLPKNQTPDAGEEDSSVGKQTQQ